MESQDPRLVVQHEGHFLGLDVGKGLQYLWWQCWPDDVEHLVDHDLCGDWVHVVVPFLVWWFGEGWVVQGRLACGPLAQKRTRCALFR